MGHRHLVALAKGIHVTTRRPWSSDEDDQLRSDMASGKSARTIAADLKRTTRSVRRRAEILKLSWKGKTTLAASKASADPQHSTIVKIPLIASPRWTPQEDESLRRLLKEGQSVRTIAERLKRTRAAVYARAKALKPGLEVN
jgi:hypothetical protein